VELKHPEHELMQNPGVYGFSEMPHGTYPPWFNPPYWNDRITPKFSLRLLMKRDVRNVALIVRYLLNHPEALLLLCVLLFAFGRLRLRSSFAWPGALLGVLIWGIYALVNVEERYVTAAYLLIMLAVFTALEQHEDVERSPRSFGYGAATVVVLFALLPLGVMAREAAENRRQLSLIGQVPAWRDAQVFSAAQGLSSMGIHPGDPVACIGTIACVNDFYWARAAGVHIVGEVYLPNQKHLADQLDGMQNRDQAYTALKNLGARVIVGSFDPGEMNSAHLGTEGWQRLGESRYYALRLSSKS
jgi:hypothetical protein